MRSFDNKKIITLFFQRQQQYILKKSSCQYSYDNFILQIKASMLVEIINGIKKMIGFTNAIKEFNNYRNSEKRRR